MQALQRRCSARADARGGVPARTDNEDGRCDLEGIASARNASL